MVADTHARAATRSTVVVCNHSSVPLARLVFSEKFRKLLRRNSAARHSAARHSSRN